MEARRRTGLWLVEGRCAQGPMRRDVTRIRQALQPIREKPTGKTYIAVTAPFAPSASASPCIMPEGSRESR